MRSERAAAGRSWAAIFGPCPAALQAASAAASRFPPSPQIAAEDHEPFRVLVSTMISLRTKDEVTSRASRALLSLAPTPTALASLPANRIARAIYPAGFYHTKARNLREASRLLLQRHAGAVPADMESLLALPGVGRKTANLVRNLGFGLPGICVDTHVHRISNRMGWVRTRTPEQTRAGADGDPAAPLLDQHQRAAGEVRPGGLYAAFAAVQRLPRASHGVPAWAWGGTVKEVSALVILDRGRAAC